MSKKEDIDQELKRIRMRKMQKIIEKKKQAEQKAKQKKYTLADKIDQVMQVLLTPNALKYLFSIKKADISAYNKIRQRLFPSNIITQIDLLLTYLRRGLIRRGMISITEIQQIERKIKGTGTRITVKRQGENAMSLGSFLKEEKSDD